MLLPQPIVDVKCAKMCDTYRYSLTTKGFAHGKGGVECVLIFNASLRCALVSEDREECVCCYNTVNCTNWDTCEGLFVLKNRHSRTDEKRNFKQMVW